MENINAWCIAADGGCAGSSFKTAPVTNAPSITD
jgi:hypothetical protein